MKTKITPSFEKYAFHYLKNIIHHSKFIPILLLKQVEITTKNDQNHLSPMMFLASELTEYVNEKEGCSATFASK